ncbi:hypothetical protein NQU59_15190 [Acinetobacter colistiniresistens]|uniref:hypothetical protein n=1 Tax=Acinetobacter colistiniresistens TaxID=280145 RepID=UPI00211B9B1A|nr:hypothetical protein [Acinetobacter colistiniresistens]UUM27004.1 hypothetical protein NQU59_15190 [Acinetobacter colistiniresistens]
MAKYPQPKITQAVLTNVPKYIALPRLTYVITAKTSEAKSTYVSKLTSFNKFMKTHKIEVNYDTAVVQVDIFLDGKWYQGAILPHLAQAESGKFTEIKFKYHQAQSSPIEENKIQKVYIKEGVEVGWLLIREDETVDALLKRIYVYPPTTKEFSIFKNNNAHLSELSSNGPMTVLKPCQVVILSNKYAEDPKLNEYKSLASSVEEKLNLLRKSSNFDAAFFAENYELLYDYWSHATEVALANVSDRKKVATVDEFKKEYCQGDSNLLDQVAEKTGQIVDSAEQKSERDKKLKKNELQVMKEKSLEKVIKSNDAIMAVYQSEQLMKSKYANPKHYSDFKKKYASLYSQLGTALKDMHVIEPQTQIPLMKKYMKTDSLIRSEAVRGGLKHYDKMIVDLGKISIGLRMGKQLVVGLGAAIFFKNTMDAYNTGDMELTKKVALIEGSKIAGGIMGGAAGNFGGKVAARGLIYIIGTVAGAVGYTISLPVSLTITAVVIGAGVIGGGKYGADFAEDELKKRTGVC